MGEGTEPQEEEKEAEMKIKAVAVLVVSLMAASALGAKRPPNIVFIFIDDMGYADPSCFGNPHVKTPHIDRLVAEGIKLTNFYVNSPICSPSRVAVTTGQYPARWRIHSYLNTRIGNKRRGMRDYLDASAPTTAKKLKASGYATAHFGKWHMGGGRDVDDAPLPSAYGFDESLVAFEGLGDRLITNPKGSTTKLGHGKISFCKRWEKTEKYTDRAIDFVRRNMERPFYVRLFPNDVHDAHVPWPGTEEKWKAVTDNPWEQKFFAVLEEMDKQIGRLVSEIDKLGLAENTLIVFTSDNGPTDWPKYYNVRGVTPPGFTGLFHGRKWSLYEGGVRMPFVARWKGTIPSGVTDDESVMSGIDLSPTFCSLAGVKVPVAEKLDGIDCGSVLLGKPAVRPPLFWQYGAPHAVLKAGKAEFQSPTFAMRDGDWKFLCNPDGSEAQLFNLIKDPGEKKNLLESDSARARKMFTALGAWATKTGFDFDQAARFTEPKPVLSMMINRQIMRFVNHGVKTVADGSWRFDGNSSLELARWSAPILRENKWIRINGSIKSSAPNGVILAHGGRKTGYSLYMKDGKLAFATCVNGKRTIITTDSVGDGAYKFELFWKNDGTMHIRGNGKLAAKGEAPGGLKSEPGDSMQIGVDLISPVGDYEGTNPYRGEITGLTMLFGK